MRGHREFFTLKLVSRELFEDGAGEFYVLEVRKHIRTGDKLRLTYPLDTLHKEA